MRLYVSASWLRREEARVIARFLELRGHQVRAAWLEEPEGAYTHTDATMTASALRDEADVEWAHGVVCLTGDGPDQASRGGKHTEVGGAIFTHKPVFLIGPREQIFHWHPRVRVCGSLDEAVDAIDATPDEASSKSCGSEAFYAWEQLRRDYQHLELRDIERLRTHLIFSGTEAARAQEPNKASA